MTITIVSQALVTTPVMVVQTLETIPTAPAKTRYHLIPCVPLLTYSSLPFINYDSTTTTAIYNLSLHLRKLLDQRTEDDKYSFSKDVKSFLTISS